VSFTGNIDKDRAKILYDHDEEELSFGDSVSVPESVQRDITEFKRLIGCEFGFHGEQNSCIRLNDLVYEFLPDPDDGYRSHLGAVICTPAANHTGFFPNPISNVILLSTEDEASWPKEWKPPESNSFSEGPFHGYFLIDADDYHLWVQIGTEYLDAYYPMFISRYSPKQPQST
jgi:hypothetical protein